ncbi:MAG: DUF1127 domain-containing protein [Rhodospirillales bacterium]|nr:MAG: DUF1127 domain-containing protein [Rhodospirillales bacterium]
MLLDRIRTDFRRWRTFRRTVNELSRLNPRQLDDIGIAPYEIEDAARGRFRR